MGFNYISGIQQVGIGVANAQEAFEWYNRNFGLDVPVFDDIAQAKLMTPHTKGVVRERRAILAVNMAGGGGAEIWQSKNPLPIAPKINAQIGDLGIFAIKYKSQDVEYFTHKHGLRVFENDKEEKSSWLQDPYHNWIQVIEGKSWFKPNESLAGGVAGVVIGVSDMNKSLKLYRDVLKINIVVSDEIGSFDEYDALGTAGLTYRRVILRKEKSLIGAFTNLFGDIEVELVQCLDRTPETIFDGRSWGDLGYIHVCFDVFDMSKLQKALAEANYSFTVDSANSFDMGEAAGRFSYIEDPDGTLIEFVETHKVPILKKIGWYINLQKRKTQKPLPNWMVATIGWGRVKLK